MLRISIDTIALVDMYIAKGFHGVSEAVDDSAIANKSSPAFL